MFDAIILAGGAGRRLGGVSKPALTVGGIRLLDLAVTAVTGAAAVVVVGPRQPVDVGDVEPQWCREEPPGSGPAAAVAAAVPLTGAQVVVVLAADQPNIAPAVPLLVAAVPPGGMARLVDPDGRPNHLAAAWDRAALVAALATLDTPVNASMRALTAGVPTADVTDAGGWGLDCDTPDDLAHARADYGQQTRTTWPSAPIRIARPSRDLVAAEHFWCAGLGLEVLFRTDDTAEGGHALAMLGWPGAGWHLELVGDPAAHARARPSEEDLLVIYTAAPIEPTTVTAMVEAGGTVVRSPNPYWNRWGITVEDPDGYRLVCSTRSWP